MTPTHMLLTADDPTHTKARINAISCIQQSTQSRIQAHRSVRGRAEKLLSRIWIFLKLLFGRPFGDLGMSLSAEILSTCRDLF